VLDRFTVATIAVSLGALTVGLLAVFARLPDRGVDLLMAGRWLRGSCTPRSSTSESVPPPGAGRTPALVGFASVLVLQLGLLVTHVAEAPADRNLASTCSRG
jgi:hypothetical protein